MAPKSARTSTDGTSVLDGLAAFLGQFGRKRDPLLHFPNRPGNRWISGRALRKGRKPCRGKSSCLFDVASGIILTDLLWQPILYVRLGYCCTSDFKSSCRSTRYTNSCRASRLLFIGHQLRALHEASSTLSFEYIVGKPFSGDLPSTWLLSSVHQQLSHSVECTQPRIHRWRRRLPQLQDWSFRPFRSRRRPSKTSVFNARSHPTSMCVPV
jgi:hypothetical protein